jgi:hypothetical protein
MYSLSYEAYNTSILFEENQPMGKRSTGNIFGYHRKFQSINQSTQSIIAAVIDIFGNLKDGYYSADSGPLTVRTSTMKITEMHDRMKSYDIKECVQNSIPKMIDAKSIHISSQQLVRNPFQTASNKSLFCLQELVLFLFNLYEHMLMESLRERTHYDKIIRRIQTDVFWIIFP